MEMTLRWYGTGYDSVTLEQIRQIPGVRGVITTLYDTLPGEIWTPERIAAMKDEVEASGLRVSGIESVNVHDAIKAGTARRDEMIDHYIQTLENLGKADIHMVCYNFMPVFDWTRTQLDKKADDGSTSLVMYWDQMKGLDPLTDDINLPGWDASYTQDEVRGLIQAYGKLGEEGLWNNIEVFLKRVIPVAEE